MTICKPTPAILHADPYLLVVANEYQTTRGLPPHPTSIRLHEVDRGWARRVARAYDQLPHSPQSPEVLETYCQLTREIEMQYQSLCRAGYRFTPWLAAGQPYLNSRGMRLDVLRRRHLAFFLGGTFAPGYPLATESKFSIGDHHLSCNDLFRIVHDVFGHALYGTEFGIRGEMSAACVHRIMFSDAAQPALATETIGQNCWFNYGPYAGLRPTKRPYHPQKAVLLPANLMWPSTQFDATGD